MPGVPIEVWQGSTLVATESTNGAGDSFFGLSISKTYELREGLAVGSLLRLITKTHSVHCEASRRAR